MSIMRGLTSTPIRESQLDIVSNTVDAESPRKLSVLESGSFRMTPSQISKFYIRVDI